MNETQINRLCTIAEALERIETPHLVLVAQHLLTLLSPDLAQSTQLMEGDDEETLVRGVFLETAYQIVQEDTPATSNLHGFVGFATNQLTPEWAYVDTTEKFIYELYTNKGFVYVVMRMHKCYGGSPFINLFEEIVDSILKLFGIHRRNEHLYKQAVEVICSFTEAHFIPESFVKNLSVCSVPVSMIDRGDDWQNQPAPF